MWHQLDRTKSFQEEKPQWCREPANQIERTILVPIPTAWGVLTHYLMRQTGPILCHVYICLPNVHWIYSNMGHASAQCPMLIPHVHFPCTKPMHLKKVQTYTPPPCLYLFVRRARWDGSCILEAIHNCLIDINSWGMLKYKAKGQKACAPEIPSSLFLACQMCSTCWMGFSILETTHKCLIINVMCCF